MHEYKGFPIVQQITARNLPQNKMDGEYTAILLLTDSYLYVLEDNFDGTYEEHHIISLPKIERLVVRTRDELNGDGKKSGVGQKAAGVLGTVIMVLFAGILLHKKGKNKKYLILNGTNTMGARVSLMFEEWGENPEKLEKAWEKRRQAAAI